MAMHVDRLYRRVVAKYREVRRTPPRIWISVFKAALAYMILVIIAMSAEVRSGFPFPIVLTGATVVVVAGYPGANIGQCIGATIFGLVGVGLGAIAFVILAKLAHAPVAQGIVFVIVVYLFALLKAKSMKFFGTALLGTLVAFAGIYTSLALPGKPFSPRYLEDYLKSYALGGAIVLSVNLLVFPISAEKELRRTLVTSLGHVRTFVHLLAKSYTVTITEEERDVRDGLAQSIRADFGILQQKLGSTTLEINYSNFSMEDYRRMIDWTNRLQQDLIGTYSTVVASETAWRSPDQSLFRKEFLPSTQASFLVLRKEMSYAVREICRVLGEGISVEELLEYEEYRGSDTPQRQAEDGRSSIAVNNENNNNFGKPHKHEDLVKRLMDGGMRRRLDTEIGVTPTPAHGRSPAVSRRQSMSELQKPKDVRPAPTAAANGHSSQDSTSTRVEDDLEGATNVASGPPSTAFPGMSATATRITSRSASPLVMGHYKFRDSQQEVLAHLLCSGEMHAADETLRLDAKQPAMTERFTAKAEREAKKDIELTNRRKGRIPSTDQDDLIMKEREKEKELTSCDPETSQGRLLLAVTSFMFLMGQFTRDLDNLHAFVVGEIGVRKKKRLHIHVFESPGRSATASEALSDSPTPVSGSNGSTMTGDDHDDNGDSEGRPSRATDRLKQKKKGGKSKDKKKTRLPMNEALAILEGRTPVYPKEKTLLQKFIGLESLIKADASLIALKTAAAAIAYTSILLAPSSRSFFIEYVLTGGVLSVVVAMSPSLGQTLFTFKNQIIGTVTGSIYGMVLLYIFRDVGGYKYNPYGITCMLIPFSFVMAYLIYTKPAYLPLGLLALNGANLVIFTLVINENTPTYTDSPALRAGKSMVAMVIGLSIAFAFQFMILRSPARRLVRQAVADLMSSMTAYYILHAAFISALNPDTESMTGERAPLTILNQVSHDLARRERSIQGKLIDIYPLLNFAKLEPDWGSGENEFRQDSYKKIISSSQLFMDRLREARVIITTLNDDNVDVDSHQDPSVFFSIPTFAPIASYRRLHNRLNKHRLYMLTTALQSKTPLPQDSLATRFVPTGVVQHDILVLTQRLTKEPDGQEIIRSSAFLRLLSYMLAVGQWRHHVNAIEEAVGDLLGVWEDDEFL